MKTPLPDSMHPQSKDWIFGDYNDRVAWLVSRNESLSEEVEFLTDKVESLTECLSKVQSMLSDIKERFSNG